MTNLLCGEPAAMTMFETTPAAPAAPAIPPYSSAEMRSYPLGTLVYRAGLMSLDTVNRALAEAAESGRRLGEVLLEYGLPERELTRLLAAQQGQEFVDLDAYPIDHEVAFLLPRATAEMYCALPLKRDGDCTVVAVPDADNASHLTRLREALHGPIRLVTAARSDIKGAIERVHEPKGTITQMALAEARAQTTPQQICARGDRLELALELPPAAQPVERERAVVDGGQHRAAGLSCMGAVAKAAVRGKRLDVLERGADVAVPELQLA